MRKYSSLATRRSFLGMSFAFIAASAFGLWQSRREKKSRLYLPYSGGESKNGLLIFDLKSQKPIFIDAAINLHQVEVLGTDFQMAVGANKYGPNYLLLNLENKSVVRKEVAPFNIQLSGHFSYSANSDILCGTGLDPQNAYQDCVVILNSKTLKFVDKILLPRQSPSHHDCRFSADSNVLMTTAGQSIDYVNLATREVTPVQFDLSNPSLQMRHFSFHESDKICAQANQIEMLPGEWSYKDAEIVFFGSGQKRAVRLLDIDVALSNAELLDFEFNHDGSIFAAVHANHSKISFWDFKKARLLKVLEVPNVSRVAYDHFRDCFLAISAQSIAFVECEALRTIHTVSLGLPAEYWLNHKTLV